MSYGFGEIVLGYGGFSNVSVIAAELCMLHPSVNARWRASWRRVPVGVGAVPVWYTFPDPSTVTEKVFVVSDFTRSSNVPVSSVVPSIRLKIMSDPDPASEIFAISIVAGSG